MATTGVEQPSKFLQGFVGDPGFSCNIEKCSPEIQARHKVDLNKPLYTTFEKQKRRFGSGEVCKATLLNFHAHL